MKKLFFLGTLAIMIVLGMSSLPNFTKANNLDSKLSGRVLLAVESNGETWYVNPVNQKRYPLKESSDVLSIMKELGLGISNNDFDSFNGKAPLRLSGRILLKVQGLGEAYYVNPVDLKMHYLSRPYQGLKLMQSLSLGITNMNLAKISVSNYENVSMINSDNVNIIDSGNVSIINSGFDPINLTVNKGATITWTNYTNSAKTVISPNNFSFGEIATGRTYDSVFNTVGTYHYYSSDNTGLTGTIIIK